MNDYWHIPRASLASSAASNASSSASSTQQHSSRAQNNGGKQQKAAAARTHATPSRRRDSAMTSSTTSAAATAAAAAAVLAAAKRGSRSSQGSSDSNNSTRSAASGSLLLTAANLERFAEIHKRQQQQQQQQQQQLNKYYLADMPHVHQVATITTAYNANLVLATSAANNANRHNDATIVDIDPNLDFIKTKDLDAVSIASSMHFTMVNGETGGAAKKPKRGLCDRGRQVTVLIVSMSAVFMLLIMGMVYALEMRAREMPQS